MAPRTILSISAASLAVALGFAVAEDKQVLPPNPVVPAKVDLPAKNFIQDVPGAEIKFEMVYLPGGEFTMGSPATEAGRNPDEGPQHPVKLRPYWIGKCEVTWDEYYAFWRDSKLFVAGEVPPQLMPKERPDAITRPTNTYVDELYNHGRDGHPALCMTHHAAMMYCHWLRWKTGLGFRLPTEAEWEFACRAGEKGRFGFDETKGKLTDYAWFAENSATEDDTDGNSERAQAKKPTSHLVGKKKANAFGLHDMHGNVSEWVIDLYDPTFYGKLPADKPSLGPVVPPGDKKWGHVVRGGSWADKPDQLRSAARRVSDKTWMKNDPQLPQSVWWLTKMDVIGFRVCLPAEEYPELAGIKPMVEKKAD